MTYTFDDAIKELEQDVFWTTGFPELPEIEFEKVKAVLNKLRDNYAPAVEMTSGNKATILDKDEGHSLSWY